ncbi:MAG: hypothetical protein U1E42_04240 [Rhodospirillales bacterium]
MYHRWARLIEVADQYRELKAQLTPAPGDPSEVALLKEQARKALDDGQLEAADELLAQIEGAQDAALDKQWQQVERNRQEFDRRQLERATTTAQRGSVELTRLRYREAAIHFERAAKLVPFEHKAQAMAYKEQEADSLCRQGD